MKHLLNKNKKNIFKLMVAGKIIITLVVLSAGVIAKNNPNSFEKAYQKPNIEQ